VSSRTEKFWLARSYETGDHQDWDALVARSRTPHFLFYRDYIEYHSTRFVDASLMVYRDDRLAAVLPANREGNVVRSHGGLTFGGLVSDASLTSARALQAFEMLCAHYRNVGCERLVYAPAPHIYHVVPAEEDLYALYRLGASLVRRDLSAALRPGSPSHQSKGRRASMKRAVERTGLVFTESPRWQEFMQLEQAVLAERHQAAPTHSPKELEALAQRFPSSIRLFCALQSDRLVAGAVVYETEIVAHTQYLGADNEGRELGALDGLISHLLQHVYNDKRYFDFGISTEDDGRRLNVGLARYKEGFGARAVAYDRYELDL
jgi:Acetyltransferase (GNAT) domain